jgi:selenide,water dikinase
MNPGIARAATDITGFSLAGHAHEMAQQSRLALSLSWESVPQLPGAADYARQGQVSGGGKLNQSFYSAHVHEARGLADWERALLYDPQTSGGLLLAAAPAGADALEQAFAEAREPLWRIGEAQAGEAGSVEVV